MTLLLFSTKTPLETLGSLAVPPGLVPMKLPATVLLPLESSTP